MSRERAFYYLVGALYGAGFGLWWANAVKDDRREARELGDARGRAFAATNDLYLVDHRATALEKRCDELEAQIAEVSE